MVVGFTSEILCMMYVGGDIEEPDIVTAEFLENIVKNEINQFCLLPEISPVTLADILYSIRHQKQLVIRLIRYMEILDRGKSFASNKNKMLGTRMKQIEESLEIWAG